ncbi:SMI1/KNR4 family protein [Pyxidicoccus parkwayensis]|uniref:SMI1/KNR4 family protein n=1 Tax=Pyxidicoccus parkwayensis TaxID=2813578 RepID=A0ABX7NTH9_9BACT|nr:SMI1/KNR4 family protein [Pyxidicoccus parkwaysis]QSQ20701.1 SMI1/KNR4 family protein [Pyxidicoccus parkwaysis]
MAHFVRTSEGGPPLTEEALRSFEEKCGVRLPTCFREFLLATNGGRPERDLFVINGLSGNPFGRIHFFFGLNDPVESCNLDWNLKVFRGRIPTGLLPIATTEGADKVCLEVAGNSVGRVVYWDAHAREDETNVYVLAENMDAFMLSLRSDELSPRLLEA